MWYAAPYWQKPPPALPTRTATPLRVPTLLRRTLRVARAVVIGAEPNDSFETTDGGRFPAYAFLHVYMR